MRYLENEKLTEDIIEQIKKQLSSYYTEEKINGLQNHNFEDLNGFLTDDILNTAKEIGLNLHGICYLAHTNSIGNYNNNINYIKETSQKYNVDPNLIVVEGFQFAIHDKVHILTEALKEGFELGTNEFRDFVDKKIVLENSINSTREDAFAMLPDFIEIEEVNLGNLNFDKSLIEIERNIYLAKINNLNTETEKKDFLKNEFKNLSGAEYGTVSFDGILKVLEMHSKIEKNYKLKAVNSLLKELEN